MNELGANGKFGKWDKMCLSVRHAENGTGRAEDSLEDREKERERERSERFLEVFFKF